MKRSRNVDVYNRRAPCIIALGAAVLGLTLALQSCQADPSEWYPEGRASIHSFHETDDGVTKSCQFYLRIENPGSARISQSTISVEVPTTLRSYFVTLVSTTSILSGGLIYEESGLDYSSLGETNAGAAAPAIVSEFYE